MADSVWFLCIHCFKELSVLQEQKLNKPKQNLDYCAKTDPQLDELRISTCSHTHSSERWPLAAQSKKSISCVQFDPLGGKKRKKTVPRLQQSLHESYQLTQVYIVLC